MAIKFSKGIRVIYSQNDFFESIYVGKHGTILGMDRQHPKQVIVLFDGHQGGVHIDPVNLELLSEDEAHVQTHRVQEQA